MKRRVLAAAVVIFAYAVPVFAGVPFESDDAGVVEVGKYEVEYSGSYSHEKQDGLKTTSHDGELSFTTGLLKNVDIGLAVPYTFQEKVDGVTAKGFGDISLGVKYAFLEAGGVNFAISPSLVMPTGEYSEDRSVRAWQPGINLIATKEFNESAALHGNVAYGHYIFQDDNYDDESRNDSITFLLAFEAKVAEPLTVGLEVGTSNPLENGNGTWNSFSLVGLSYEVKEGLELNAGVRFGLNENETDFTTLYGVTFTF